MIAERGKALLLEAVSSLPDEDSDELDAEVGTQLSLDDLVKPVDWPEGQSWGTLTIDASCTPADITYPTDLKLLNEARESTQRIIDDLCKQSSDLRKHRPDMIAAKHVPLSSLLLSKESHAGQRSKQRFAISLTIFSVISVPSTL